MGTATKHPMPDRVKQSFVIFVIWALQRSGLMVRVPGCQNYNWRQSTQHCQSCEFNESIIWQVFKNSYFEPLTAICIHEMFRLNIIYISLTKKITRQKKPK